PAARWNLNQKSHRNISPSQNTGADTKNSANPIASRSNRVRGLSAETMPIGIPIRSHTRDAPIASWLVMTRRWMMIGFSAERVLNDRPSPGQPYWSPRKMCRTNRKYWTYQGWFRPNCLLTSARICGVGCLPANSNAGSVGDITKKITYVMSVTTSRTKTTHNRRLAMYRHMSTPEYMAGAGPPGRRRGPALALRAPRLGGRARPDVAGHAALGHRDQPRALGALPRPA